MLSVGYLVLDVIAGAQVIGRSAGGTAGNVAANLAWLGHQSGLLAQIGEDSAGGVVRDDLESAGVDTTHVHHSVAVETPILIQRITDRGPQYLFKCPFCNYKFASHRPATPEQAAEAGSEPPSMLFVDRASKAALNLMATVKSAGGIVVFEPNGPGRLNLTAEAIRLADILKVSADRIPSLGGLLSATPEQQIQIRTRGPEGLAFRMGQRSWHKRRARRVPINDPAGAGDWVTAGLLAHLTGGGQLNYHSISAGLDLGQALAAVSCAFIGARGMNRSLTWDQASTFLERPAVAPWDTPYRSGQPPQLPTPDTNETCPACGSRVGN